MSDNYKQFVQTFSSPNTIKVINSLSAIGDYDCTNCTLDDLKHIILDMKPNSPRGITTICYVLGLYAKFLNNDKLYCMIQEINRVELWNIAKPNAAKKFISHSSFEETCHDIDMYEEFNSLYYQTLFRCLYEGIYNDDMSVVKNLKASDIHENVVTLNEDNGNSYELKISAKLADDLRELGATNTWERKNRYTVCQIKTSGLYPDSCFKVENRNGSAEYSYRYSYYRMLRKISKEYLEFNLLPFQIYISGIMYRIRTKLEDNNIDLTDAFSDHNRDRLVAKIIASELKRCNCDIEVRNFREIVKGHLDIFIS